ncbi:EpsG family protein [Bacteroides cellulosilyticus]|jgi:hypothetical protein|uniref:EpsG family protein n=1 Tax=Bacteroides cellulosilyticus TaxID=246787 RepID=UPI0018ACCBF2|nr:EpsG family protein [Bacteroides cellulosilyticus]
MAYFLIYLLISFFAIKFSNSTIDLHKFKNASVICLFIFIFIAGLRYELGVDYFAYRESFIESMTIWDLFSNPILFMNEFVSGSWEPGSKLLLILLRSITSDAQILFFIVSIICSILLFKSLKYFSEPRFFFFSLLIYFSFVYMFQEMHALRQALGACVLYYGLYQLALGNTKKAVFISILSVCFHYSMIIFLPLLFLLKKKIGVKVQLTLITISFFIFLLQIRWLAQILDVISGVYPELKVVMRVTNYVNADTFERPFYITFILYIVPYLFLLYMNYKKKLFDSSKDIIAQNMYLFYLLFTMIFWEFAFFSIRYGWICLWGMAICLPRLIDCFKYSSKVIPVGYIVCFCYIIIHTFLFPDITTRQFSPYENYIECKWFGVKGTGRERVEDFAAELGFVFVY